LSLADVLTLLSSLDELFGLAGKLIEAAQGKHPELVTTPLPDLSEMDRAREEAIKRVS